jgi:hypothetical protein
VSKSGRPVTPILPLQAAERSIRRKRPRAIPLSRHIVEADTHRFVGRIFDLSIVGMRFETYDELAQYDDCKYAFDVNFELSTLVQRVESLNLVGDMIWPTSMPEDFKEFPISRYDWLTVAADAFLMRYVSVVDCAQLLVNAVYELGLDPRKCTLENLTKKVGAPQVIKILEATRDDQGDLRKERNARFHHGSERGFTQDPTMFRITALYERRGQLMEGGIDRDGRRIDVRRSFNEGLVELQRDFNRSSRRLSKRLGELYDELGREFEARFALYRW